MATDKRTVVEIVEERMHRALRGERIEWKHPAITYGDIVRDPNPLPKGEDAGAFTLEVLRRGAQAMLNSLGS